MNKVVSLAEYKEQKELRQLEEDEMLMEEQYQEFLSLLQYFVNISDIKCRVAIIKFTGENEFTLSDWQGNPISCKPDDILVELANKEMEREDLLVSTLINLSPGKIEIHGQEFMPVQMKNSICVIFESREVSFH